MSTMQVETINQSNEVAHLVFGTSSDLAKDNGIPVNLNGLYVKIQLLRTILEYIELFSHTMNLDCGMIS